MNDFATFDMLRCIIIIIIIVGGGAVQCSAKRDSQRHEQRGLKALSLQWTSSKAGSIFKSNFSDQFNLIYIIH